MWEWEQQKEQTTLKVFLVILFEKLKEKKTIERLRIKRNM